LPGSADEPQPTLPRMLSITDDFWRMAAHSDGPGVLCLTVFWRSCSRPDEATVGTEEPFDPTPGTMTDTWDVVFSRRLKCPCWSHVL
jgi:hypothetical protein